jgi:hypothetical protein
MHRSGGKITVVPLSGNPSCLEALCTCLEPEVRRAHEGVAYLLGQSDGTVAVAVAAVSPAAVTTPGSFSVSAPATAVNGGTRSCVRLARAVRRDHLR